MARRGVVSFGIGMTAGAAAYAVLTSGALVAGTGSVASTVGALFRLPPAAAEGLPAFEDCDQLRQWYVDQALPDVGPWGLGGPPVVYAGGVRRDAAPEASDGSVGNGPDDPVGSSATGTNVQDLGVDEADVAKTDGSRVFQLRDGRLVVTDVSGSRPRRLSSTDLPGAPLGQPELVLGDDGRALVVGTEQRAIGGPIEPYGVGGPVEGPTDLLPTGGDQSRTVLLDVDVTDPAHPRVSSDRRVDGRVISTRSYPDGTVRVVVTTGYPPLDFVQPNRDRTPGEATAENRSIVRAAPVSAWLPGIRTGAGPKKALLDCDQVRHPSVVSGLGTISVLTLSSGDPSDLEATAVTASGDLVYSSGERLYVATTQGGWSMPVPSVDGSQPVRPTALRTEVHAFALDGGRTTYVASGTLAGRIKDRWSFSEQDGYLRVATGLGRDWRSTDNAVTVLEEQGGRLRPVGRVDGIGRDEDIASVRWFGDLAVVVTFRQTDPVYTVDLTDPERPRVVGALKIPGFSSYLHPVGGDRLVGLGHDATAQGADLGAQVASFDLTRLTDVRRTDTLALGPDTDVSAGVDAHTFSYLPAERVLLTLVTDWATGAQRFVAVHVDRDGTLTETGAWPAGRWDGDLRTLPLGHGRVALVGDAVRVVDVG